MKTVSFALAAAAILATVATAQNQLPVKKVTGPIKTLQYGVHTPKASPVIVYSNTIQSGYYSVPGTNEEWIDHGIITGNGDHDTITGAQIGYATTLLTGPAIRVRTYDGYTGFCGSLTGLGWDVSISGLPGSTSGAAGWLVTLDMSAGACFYQDNNPFGYSYSYSNGGSGPLLASGGNGNLDRFDWTPIGSPSCGSWWFGGPPGPWAGFYTEFTGHDGNDSFGLGCGGGLTLSINGATCAGGTVQVDISNATVGAFWAIGVGLGAGTGIGGAAGGGCAWDTALLIPPVVMGMFPVPAFGFSASQTVVAPAIALGIQVVSKYGIPTPPVWDTSNVEIINTP